MRALRATACAAYGQLAAAAAAAAGAPAMMAPITGESTPRRSEKSVCEKT
jgi:hypothetical protein